MDRSVEILWVATLLAGQLQAGDWPQWGGTLSRNMYSPEKGLPELVDPGKTKSGSDEVDLATTKNVKWVAKLGSQTYGNVTIAQGKVLIGTNNDNPRDPQHVGDRSVLYCFDEKSGEFLWQLVVPKLKAGKVSDWEGLGILSCPVVEGNRVYLVTSRCEMICLDLQGMADGNQGPFQDEENYRVTDTGKPAVKSGPKDADILWVYDMIDQLGVFPHNASNSSPLIVGDLVYVCTANGQDWTHNNVPCPFAPSLVALNKSTGALAGEDDAGIGPRILHSQWGSPSAGKAKENDLIFFGGGDGFLYAFSAKPVKTGATSQLKTQWSFDCNPPEYRVKDGKPVKYPSQDGASEVNATPVFYKDRVYLAIGQDPEHGEGVGQLVCVDATQHGDVSKTAAIWTYQGIHRSVSTVSIDPDTGLLFVGDFSGIVHCLDAETGKVQWTYDMKAHVWGSTLVADGKVYCGDEDGDLTILVAGKEKKVLSECNLAAPIYSTPVAANGSVYVSTPSQLWVFRKSQ